MKCDIKQLSEWLKESDTHRIFYIHGYISDPNSLVMTQRSYRETYTEGYVASILQIDAAAHYTLLFLGSSLENDKTVDVINQQIDSAGIHSEARCIPVFSSKQGIEKCGLHNEIYHQNIEVDKGIANAKVLR